MIAAAFRPLGIRILSAATLIIAVNALSVFGQDADSAVAPSSPRNRQRIALQQKCEIFWKNGNVAEALDSAIALVEVEKELYGSTHQRIAERYAILCSYALELNRTEQAEQFAALAAGIYREGNSPGSWQHTESLRLENVTRQLIERPLTDRQELYGWKRQLQQSIDDYNTVREMEAAEHYARVCREYFGDRHPLSIMAMAYVQLAEIRLGRLETADNQLKKLRIELHQVEHPQHPNHAALLFILAELAVANGEMDTGLRAASDSVEKFTKAGMAHSVNCLVSLTLQGYLFVFRGEYQQALEPLRKAYKAGLREGMSHDRMQMVADQLCIALKQVARSEWEQQHWPSADQLMNEAYRISVEQWGEDNFRAVDIRVDPIMTSDAESWSAQQRETYEQIESLRQQMQSLLQSGKTQEALDVAKQRHAKLAGLFGRTNAETLRGRFDVLHLLTDPAIAGSQDQQAIRSHIIEYLNVLREQFGTAHWEYASACMEFASRLDSDDPMMLELTRKALDGFRDSLTENSDDYAESLTVLGCILAEQINEDAIQYLDEANDLWESRANRDGYAHCQAVATLGALYYNLDDAYEARHLLASAADRLRALENQNVNYDLAVVLNFLGNISADHERFEDARRYYTEAISLFETGTWNERAGRFGKSLDDYTATYQWCLYNAANTDIRLGQYDEAEQQIEKLIRRFPAHSPHQTYRSALYTQATVYAHQGREDEAQSALKRASKVVDDFYNEEPIVRGKLFLIQAKVAMIGTRLREAREIPRSCI